MLKLTPASVTVTAGTTLKGSLVVNATKREGITIKYAHVELVGTETAVGEQTTYTRKHTYHVADERGETILRQPHVLLEDPYELAQLAAKQQQRQVQAGQQTEQQENTSNRMLEAYAEHGDFSFHANNNNNMQQNRELPYANESLSFQFEIEIPDSMPATVNDNRDYHNSARVDYKLNAHVEYFDGLLGNNNPVLAENKNDKGNARRSNLNTEHVEQDITMLWRPIPRAVLDAVFSPEAVAASQQPFPVLLFVDGECCCMCCCCCDSEDDFANLSAFVRVSVSPRPFLILPSQTQQQTLSTSVVDAADAEVRVRISLNPSELKMNGRPHDPTGTIVITPPVVSIVNKLDISFGSKIMVYEEDIVHVSERVVANGPAKIAIRPGFAESQMEELDKRVEYECVLKFSPQPPQAGKAGKLFPTWSGVNMRSHYGICIAFDGFRKNVLIDGVLSNERSVLYCVPAGGDLTTAVEDPLPRGVASSELMRNRFPCLKNTPSNKVPRSQLTAAYSAVK